MSNVTIDIKNREFLIACEDGKEEEVLELAKNYIPPSFRKDINVLGRAGMGILYSAINEFRMGEYILKLLLLFLSPFLIGPLSKYKPISAMVVAKSMIAATKQHLSKHVEKSCPQVYCKPPGSQ